MSDLVLQLPSSFINNCEPVYYDLFFSLKTLINFIVPLVGYIIYKIYRKKEKSPGGVQSCS